MRTFIKTSMIGCMVLAIVCLTAPFGHTQGVTAPKTLCAKCGVVTDIGKCQPIDKSTDYPCVSINSYGRMKPAEAKPNVTLPYSKPNSPSKTAAR